MDREGLSMDDLISRQALCEYALNQKDKSVTLNDIMRFPSAQPEIIRCIECRWGREPCDGNIECFVDANVPPEYHGYNWFCPNGERRTEE